MSIIGIIPARYASTRFPGKPLAFINGKSIIQRVFEQCKSAEVLDKVVVATDDQRIYKHCVENDIQVEMTSENCLTGTDRIAEFSKKIQAKTYINVQGDEPIMNPKDILKIINLSQKYPNDVINGYAPIDKNEDYNSLTIPKVVFRPDSRLLYMSRSPIPGNKQGNFRKSWRQICVYGFPKQSLLSFFEFDKKTTLEQEEDIEILRFLELGYDVRMVELSSDSIAVDTAEDAEKVRNYLKD